MTSLDNRERAFEDKFARDAALAFQVMARRNKLVGLWAAGLLGKTAEEAVDFAKEVVASDFDEPGEEDVFRKLNNDLAGTADEAQIRDAMATSMIEARRQIMDAG